MNLPPLSELYSHGTFLGTAGTTHLNHLPVQTNQNRPYPNFPRTEENEFPPLTSISSTLPSFDVPLSPQNLPVCEQCKGQKYNFTAYFHNTKIFAEPPHHLLNCVERSYILKNQLQSLLVTYALQEVDPDHIQDIEVEINTWGTQVDSLAHEVASFWSRIDPVLNVVTEVHRWTKAMMKQIWEHVQGTQMLPMPKGRVKELVLAFRKGWEGVWIACAAH
jgi:hypothetical protein